MENAIGKRYTQEVRSIVAGDTQLLFNGTLRLKDSINNNIEKYVSKKKLISLGLKANISVSTSEGVPLYPQLYENEKKDYLNTDNITIARENYRMLTDGLIVKVQIKVNHNTIVANAILLFFISLSVTILGVFYKTGVNKSKKDEIKRKSEIEKLKTIKEKSLSNLSDLEKTHDALSNQMVQIKETLYLERKKAIDTEDEMVEEMVALEEKISANINLYEEKEDEILKLKTTIEQLEKKKAKKNIKVIDAAKRRFATLYKNVVVNDRAVSGYNDLTEDMKIKAEEVIHQLNDDPREVTIKRKVFGKKNRETVFEIIFAYKGRLYFRNTRKTGVEVLVIGTKHTQGSDLAFLDNL
ncbi:MAG: hypothetical protein GY699_23900 [Desulfobacteraceae bacterium]|nr:hypothetical protein [Desulfobacteraceae bacterium]